VPLELLTPKNLIGIKAHVSANLSKWHAPLTRLREPPARGNLSASLEFFGIHKRGRRRRGLNRGRWLHQVLIENIARKRERAETGERNEDAFHGCGER
jgi:hypothetical protein